MYSRLARNPMVPAVYTDNTGIIMSQPKACWHTAVLKLINLLPEFSEARLTLTSCYEEEESDDESVAKVEKVG